MAAPGKKRATYQDVLDAPETRVAEIINGELHLSPRPKWTHQTVTSALGSELYQSFQRGRGGPNDWVLLDEPELHFGDDIVVPDLAGWRRERFPFPTDDGDISFFTVAPDWICEALSRSTERIDRGRKLGIYAAAGVRFAWLVNARNRTLEVMRLHEGKWLLLAVHQGDARVRAEPFEAIELDLGLWWSDLPPPSRAAEGGGEYACW